MSHEPANRKINLPLGKFLSGFSAEGLLFCPRVYRAESSRINNDRGSVKSNSYATGTEASINRLKLPSNPALTPTVNGYQRGSEKRLDFLKQGSPVKLGRLERGPGQRAGSGRK